MHAQTSRNPPFNAFFLKHRVLLTEIRRASQNETQMCVPHEFVSVIFDIIFEECEAITKACEHTAHVSAGFHGDDPNVVFFVYPHQKVLVLVVPDSAGVGPVTCHAC